ncbi:translational activator of GCN4 [Nowakowskiella sp. JEL0078]|nr:translational activator of GCN4 [Nowakowskiella sp. JEL0078]
MSVRCVGILLSSQEYLSGAEDAAVNALIKMMIDKIKVENQAEVRRESLVVLKNVAKQNYELFSPHLVNVIPLGMICVRERVFPIKHAAERLLVYALKINEEKTSQDSTGHTLKSYLDAQDAPTARLIGDYARRVLSKISDNDSDNEEE